MGKKSNFIAVVNYIESLAWGWRKWGRARRGWVGWAVYRQVNGIFQE